ncbi:tetratricopeptide repeat protein, partial [Bacteroidota bacterium]
MLLQRKRYILIAVLIFAFVLSGFVSTQAQTDREGLKISALAHMDAGRYGEAIDLLNKYISANPRQAEGYHLRAQCFEQRSQFQESVLDYRRARRLAPNNQKIIADLNRTMEIWHALLYRKIEGHQREIAINPNNPFNYLEIGKSYRWLEIWHLAEEWYDEYLARDKNASPDEIIRYTEILAKTGSIVKGERILKIYVERYPGDWRLWSRYGYFTLWLSKYRTAKKAFETALSYKPFFKEAQDGLDLANRQGYIRQYKPRAFEKVYLIDEYFRRLKRDPLNHEIRFKLVDELIKKKRLEEASQQLAMLAKDHYESEKYYYYAAMLDSISTNLYESQVEEYSALIKLDPSNKRAVVDLANAYGRLYAYDEA